MSVNPDRKPRHFQVDDRHNISSPREHPAKWAKTLTVERISDLFRTQRGLPGHVERIQGELNRCKDLEGLDGTVVVTLMTNLKKMVLAVKKAKAAAPFALTGAYSLEFPHIKTVVVI